MNVLEFTWIVIAVTASGALAPGPLFFGTFINGIRGGARSGFSCAIGHTMVEFPLVLALALGLLQIEGNPTAKTGIQLIGGLALILFGSIQISRSLRMQKSILDRPSSPTQNSSVLMGIMMTGLNPIFIIWWLSVGSVLVVQALAIAAMLGVLIMYIAHVWMDYAFLTTVAYLARKGRAFMSSRLYRGVLVAFAVFLIGFGVTLIGEILL